jgi:hypothetical protein
VVLTTETGKSEGPRFHSRFLCPGWTLLEDSVTGSAHCLLGVIYAPRFDAIGKFLTATQGGKRRGQITVVWDGKAGKEGGRMKLRGKTLTGKGMDSVMMECVSNQILQSLRESFLYNTGKLGIIIHCAFEMGPWHLRELQVTSDNRGLRCPRQCFALRSSLNFMDGTSLSTSASSLACKSDEHWKS